jgi:FKBP-type peptidyl-prolyl cis-trans isomerase FklB
MKTKLIIVSVLIVGVIAAFSFTDKTDKKPKTMKLENEIDSVSYSLGVNIATSMNSQGVEGLNTAVLAKAMDDVFASSDLEIDEVKANGLIQSYFTKLQGVKTEKDQAAGRIFLEENKKKDGVVELASGLQYRILKAGTGPKPLLTDKVKTHYHGTTIDGKVFDSSVEKGQPISFPLTGVIKGWTEALQLMPVGSKWELVIPYDLAYGERGQGPDIGPYATLVFEVELLGIE